MAVASRRVKPSQFERACTYLRKSAMLAPNVGEDAFFKGVQIYGGADDGLQLDGLVRINKNRLELLSIWIMDYNPKVGMPSARNMDGEKGNHARILGEKYFNALLEDVQKTDVENLTQREALLTPELMKEVEAQIDRTVTEVPLTETVARLYNRMEIIQFSIQVLRQGLRELDIPLHDVNFDEKKCKFDITIYPDRKHLSLSLLEIVALKRARSDSFTISLFKAVTDWLMTWCDVSEDE